MGPARPFAAPSSAREVKGRGTQPGGRSREAHDFSIARYYCESLRAVKQTLGLAAELSLPCLILQAEEDFLSDPAASREFYERVPHADMRFVLYGGFYHEVLNEVEQARVIEEIVRWVEEHLSEA